MIVCQGGRFGGFSFYVKKRQTGLYLQLSRIGEI